jgi:hypothetical protein
MIRLTTWDSAAANIRPNTPSLPAGAEAIYST